MKMTQEAIEQQLSILKQSLEIYGETGLKMYEAQKELLLASNQDEVDTEEIQRLSQKITELQEELNKCTPDFSDSEVVEDNEEDEDMDNDNENDDVGEDDAPGFNAIVRTVEKLYPGQDNKGFATQIPMYLGGNDPLDFVLIYESQSGGISHWHYITCGFSELYEKECDDEEYSGYGFELTFRLKKEEDNPPTWPFSLLQNIARYVFKTGNIFEPGHHMNANGPIQLNSNTKLTALAFISDSELGMIDTPNGELEFVQMVGITADELEAITFWNGLDVINTFNKYIPLGITVMDRESFMSNPDVVSEINAGIDRDGSSTGYLYSDQVGYAIHFSDGKVVEMGDVPDGKYEPEKDCTVLYLGAGQIEKIINMLKGRLLKGRDLRLIGKNGIIQFISEDKNDFYFDNQEANGDFVLCLNESGVKEIEGLLKPKAGIYKMSSVNVTFVIIQTIIRDSNGNEVERIG